MKSVSYAIFMNDRIINHFKTNDPVISNLISLHGLIQPHYSKDYFFDLVDAVISQQLSEKAGATILKRFQSLFTGSVLTPQSVLQLSLETIRSCGTSNAKAIYIQNIARAFSEKSIPVHSLASMSNDEVIATLTKITGIGKWTAEMFLIFSLGRDDVFSYGDAGLIRAIKNLYGNGSSVSKKMIDMLVVKWSPYKSYASLALWKSLNNT